MLHYCQRVYGIYWEQRYFDSNEYLSEMEAIKRVAALLPCSGPVVLADASDNPGSGAYGDSTFLLKSMLEAGLENSAFGMICDPEAVEKMIRSGVGKSLKLQLGGKIDPIFGPPLSVNGEVRNITDGKYVALVHAGVGLHSSLAQRGSFDLAI